MAGPNTAGPGRPPDRRPSWSAGDSGAIRVPAVANAERDLAAGDYDRAVREGYHRVVLDLQKAYGLTLPAQWTHREFLSDFLRDDMGILTTLVARLYRLYEPVRYGTKDDWSAEDPVPLLIQIYSEPPMRDLYRAEPDAPPPTGSRKGTAAVVPNATDRSRRPPG